MIVVAYRREMDSGDLSEFEDRWFHDDDDGKREGIAWIASFLADNSTWQIKLSIAGQRLIDLEDHPFYDAIKVEIKAIKDQREAEAAALLKVHADIAAINAANRKRKETLEAMAADPSLVEEWLRSITLKAAAQAFPQIHAFPQVGEVAPGSAVDSSPIDATAKVLEAHEVQLDCKLSSAALLGAFAPDFAADRERRLREIELQKQLDDCVEGTSRNVQLPGHSPIRTSKMGRE